MRLFILLDCAAGKKKLGGPETGVVMNVAKREVSSGSPTTAEEGVPMGSGASPPSLPSASQGGAGLAAPGGGAVSPRGPAPAPPRQPGWMLSMVMSVSVCLRAVCLCVCVGVV